MKVSQGTYIAKHLDEFYIDSQGDFKAVVIHGVDNFTWKKIYMASVRCEGRSSTGYFYTTFEEASREAREILERMYLELEADKIKWRKEYEDAEKNRPE